MIGADYAVDPVIDWLSNREMSLMDERQTQEPRHRLNFGQALEHLKRGRRVQRTGWNGKGMYIQLQVPDEHSKMGLPYLYIKTVDDLFVPWLASQTDILADDWQIV